MLHIVPSKQTECCLGIKTSPKSDVIIEPWKRRRLNCSNMYGVALGSCAAIQYAEEFFAVRMFVSEVSSHVIVESATFHKF